MNRLSGTGAVAFWDRARGALPRAAVFALMWWVLTEGASDMLQYGFVVVPLSAALSLMLLPPRRRSGPLPRRLLAGTTLLLWFLWQSFRGGADVAVRALRRPVDLDPGMVTHHTTLPDDMSRVALTAITSLMPGTLSVNLEGTELYVHVLDRSMRTGEQLAELEQRLSTLVG
ncbi:Na+/H+ antiporter subunit E [Hoyosella subflava]|uniref:Multisubunit Na+/H+ antiporter, MnhE subunit n=1 Tax=Hoyosella subflava (strain DSM 45089 / JCM 17490 / NBRC 109087 / DQS3-9A1) TaxID=443218 RepID=F6EIU3_HOYSD|nr:Na+/H+ antiporter subunit E [Hoyosella subflava]AEF40004.1 Multisubunit Na+/H+ antiporter, MnhE subunit [Hoyosella subflava DQS3-9A1]